MLTKKMFTLTDKNISELKNEADKVGIRSSEMLRRILDERYKANDSK